MLNFYNSLVNQIPVVQITDILDILIITVLLYQVLKFIRDSKTKQLIKGVIFFVVITQVSQLVKLYTLHYLLSSAMQLGLVAIMVVFQPELRKGLEKLGKTTGWSWITRILGEEKADEYREETRNAIAEVKKSCMNMSKSRIGALIVFERDAAVNSEIDAGILVDAKVSSELIENIFVPNTPLHDGAVIIRKNRIDFASCFFRLSHNPDLSKQLGTRHRAGLGVSEDSDAVVVIVSEETGGISIACDGELVTKLTPDELEKNLLELLGVSETVEKSKKLFFGRKESNNQ